MVGPERVHKSACKPLASLEIDTISEYSSRKSDSDIPVAAEKSRATEKCCQSKRDVATPQWVLALTTFPTQPCLVLFWT